MHDHCFYADSAPESQQIFSSEEEMTVTIESSPHTISDIEWTGFKIVGDNIDKTVRPRFMRSDSQVKSLHYFQSYAVRDRINLTNVSDSPPLPSNDPDLLSLLPSSNDITTIQHLFEIHVARIVIEHIPFMKSAFSDVVDWHIHHEYYEEMETKSDIVSSTL